MNTNKLTHGSRHLVPLSMILIAMCVKAYSNVTIDGLNYDLYQSAKTAMLLNYNKWEGELEIPSEVTYEGNTYTVTSMSWLAFYNCKTLTKVKIPKTIQHIYHINAYPDCKNPFTGCTSLEAIEVDEENLWMCSIDGALFNKDKTMLYCYPVGAKRESYTVPEGVTWIGGAAFANDSSLVSVQLPNTLTYMSFSIFADCTSLEEVSIPNSLTYIAASTFEHCYSLKWLDIPANITIFGENVFRGCTFKALVFRGVFDEDLRKDTFYSLGSSTIIYAQPSEIYKFQKVFSGTVLPLENYVPTDIPNIEREQNSYLMYDLNGRITTLPQKGIYIQNGKKRHIE
ncbi:MAG: leucine-rich repeat domain-containing protein [Prevotella sp.]|nr:leucine-rich repeat domain-containing protein [Prevotella sp.]